MSTNEALLKKVSLTAEGQFLVARFDVEGSIPGSGAYVVGLMAAGPDFSSQRRLGIEFMNGEAIAFYTFNHGQGTEENYDLGGVSHSGATITGHFPLSALHGLGKGHVISAFSEADGREFQSGVRVEEAL